jgi:squalene/oxidosqualene cyclase-like protein
VLEIVRAEDAATDFICLGPINKLFNTLVWHFENPGGPELRRHLERLPDYLWQAGDGLKMQGYNSSELWDTAFAVQAAIAGRRYESCQDALRSAHRFVEANQVLADVPQRERAYRDRSRGGWPFSTRAHGWPISDCTAEGLKASILLEPHVDEPISAERLTAAMELILTMQNRDGGWATYERTRGPAWLERLNPSDCFADIMIDPSYVECTSACVQALSAFRARYPGVREDAIGGAIARGRDFLRATQRPDGSWEGSWGICFTYGTWFGTWGTPRGGTRRGSPGAFTRRRVLDRQTAPRRRLGRAARELSCPHLRACRVGAGGDDVLGLDGACGRGPVREHRSTPWRRIHGGTPTR